MRTAFSGTDIAVGALKCPGCRYSFAGFTRGSEAVCPECGVPVDWAAAAKRAEAERERAAAKRFSSIGLMVGPHIGAMVFYLIGTDGDGMPRTEWLGLVLLIDALVSPFFAIAGLHRLCGGSLPQEYRKRAIISALGCAFGLALSLVVPLGCSLFKAWLVP